MDSLDAKRLLGVVPSPSPPSPSPSPTTLVHSAVELHALLATNQTTIHAHLNAGTHLFGTTFVVRNGKRLTLCSDGAVLDAQDLTRHFLVQDGGGRT